MLNNFLLLNLNLCITLSFLLLRWLTLSAITIIIIIIITNIIITINIITIITTINIITIVSIISLFLFHSTASGLKQIEAGAFVSPQYVPQMSNSDDVFLSLRDSYSQTSDVIFSALTPNLKGR